MARNSTNETTKYTIRLSQPAREAVETIMTLGGFPTIQEAIRRSIGDELYLLRQQKEGWTVLLRKDSEYRELVFAAQLD